MISDEMDEIRWKIYAGQMNDLVYTQYDNKYKKTAFDYHTDFSDLHQMYVFCL